MNNSQSQRISAALSISARQISSALELFDEGGTVPFVARYRKERTGGLDEVQLRQISEENRRLKDLDQRRDSILEAIKSQGKLDSKLLQRLNNCASKTELEDLYAPFKKRRKTRADKAREQGLGGLASKIIAQPRHGNPRDDAKGFLNTDSGVEDVDSALAGARDIVSEELALKAENRVLFRELMRRHGSISSVVEKKAEDPGRFRDYLDYSEGLGRMASHRYLAVCRGESEGVLKVKMLLDVERSLQQLLRRCRYFPRSPYGEEFNAAAEDSLKRLLLPSAARAVRSDLKNSADDEAIDVFQKNLEALLLSAPLGSVPVLGIDPGIRTGCKCAMVDASGALVDYQTFYLVGRKNSDGSGLAAFLRKHAPSAVAVGNGTGGREAERFVRDLLKSEGMNQIRVVSVNEAGASIYSASELAREELPDVDLTVRGAVSIARRLQDPLAELVKIDPKSIGVGQYQHDVDQGKLNRRLHEVVESCVNRVGVDLNTASPSLLSHVSGIGPKLAKELVHHRESKGKFTSRKELKKVKGLGGRTFEQCAGFLKIRDGENPLDASAVHPERYKLVQKIAKDMGVPLKTMIGNPELAGRVRISDYIGEDVGVETLRDIVDELKKPGRDPRENFESVAFREDVNSISDLEVGMRLNGVVTNVTNFGAFVDIGVHQDGLVHISELANRYVSSPHEVVQAGQKTKVLVLSVDERRKRISLSIKQV